LTIFALMIMSIHLSVFTVCLYVILGADFGWNCAVMKPMMQDLIPMDSQSTAMSLIDTLSRLFYIPLVWVVGIAGNSNIRLSMVATIMIFLPLVILITIKLRHLEK